MIVLGVSGVLGHDPAACLLRDGKLVAFAEEERFTRQKYAPAGFPLNATAYCLSAAGIAPDAVDVLATSWDPALDPSSDYLASWLPRFVGHAVWHGHRPEEIYVPHHVAHAAAAAYFAGVSEGAVLIVDGNGENTATTIARLDDDGWRVLEEYPVTQSLGHFYLWAAAYLGLGAHGEGRMMGLAGYGQARADIDPLSVGPDGYSIDFEVPTELPTGDRLRRVAALWDNWFQKRYGPADRGSWSWDPEAWRGGNTTPSVLDRADIAAAAQHKLVDAVVALARRATALAEHDTLIFGGGVALNCGANAAILASDAATELALFPACGDAGGALGAAAWAARGEGDPWETPTAGPYLGPSASSAAVRHALERSGLRYRLARDPAREAAELISQGRIIAWSRGAMEAGPRALGNRSILARVDKPEVAARVNAIKAREAWRPLGPSVTSESAGRFFTNSRPAPYMLEFRDVREDARSSMAGVAHVDGTTRPQLVTATANPEFHRLLTAVGDLTDVPAVINTSFNVGPEPIVCSPADAIRTYVTSGLDALVMDEYVLTKAP